jgi:hypothetical protein
LGGAGVGWGEEDYEEGQEGDGVGCGHSDWVFFSG